MIVHMRRANYNPKTDTPIVQICMTYGMTSTYLEGGLALGSIGHVKRDIGPADNYVKAREIMTVR